MKKEYEKPTLISEPVALDLLRAQTLCCKVQDYYDFDSDPSVEEGCTLTCSCPSPFAGPS